MNERKRKLKRKNSFLVEKSIIIIVISMLVLLIGFNVARTYGHYIAIQFSRFNFNNICNFKNNIPSQGIVEIAVEDDKIYPMLEIIINGELFDYKFEENNRVMITVYDGDVIQINGSMYSDNIKVKIKEMSSNITNILDNNHIILKGDISTLAVIRT